MRSTVLPSPNAAASDHPETDIHSATSSHDVSSNMGTSKKASLQPMHQQYSDCDVFIYCCCYCFDEALMTHYGAVHFHQYKLFDLQYQHTLVNGCT